MDAMPALFIFAITSILFVVLSVAAALWGTDSRPGMGDDHPRRTA